MKLNRGILQFYTLVCQLFICEHQLSNQNRIDNIPPLRQWIPRKSTIIVPRNASIRILDRIKQLPNVGLTLHLPSSPKTQRYRFNNINELKIPTRNTQIFLEEMSDHTSILFLYWISRIFLSDKKFYVCNF